MTLNISRTEHNRDPQAAPDVQDVQAALISKGYSCGSYGADGDFGADTNTAVVNYQRAHGLTADGIVGPNTWTSLKYVLPAAALSAVAFADKAYALVTGGIDGTKPIYRFGAEVANLAEPSPDALDCSELVQWAVYQITKNSWRDGSSNQAAGCRIISAVVAAKTKGALLFITSNGRTDGVHHVAISMGNGRTAEARSTSSGVGSWPAPAGFSFGGIIPILRYV